MTLAIDHQEAVLLSGSKDAYERHRKYLMSNISLPDYLAGLEQICGLCPATVRFYAESSFVGNPTDQWRFEGPVD